VLKSPARMSAILVRRFRIDIHKRSSPGN